jgi:HAD superfamily hydrolase (TIGR01509 family)
MDKNGFELLLFDLGGVLVEYTGLKDVRRLLNGNVGDDEFARLVAATAPCWGNFECGRMTPDEFLDEFVSVWPLAVTRERFESEFQTWTRGLLPGAEETLAELRPRYRLAALSNSNALHWRRITGDHGLPALMERVFGSHEIGWRKPAREAYEHVLAELNVRPQQTVFFDDLQENVQAARDQGMQAYRVAGVEELRRCLRELGCLAA